MLSPSRNFEDTQSSKMLSSPKEERMKVILSRFELKGQQYADYISNGLRSDELAITNKIQASRTQRLKDMEIHKKQATLTDTVVAEEWMKGQNKARARRDRIRRFKERAKDTKVAAKELANVTAAAALRDGTAAFTKVLTESRAAKGGEVVPTENGVLDPLDLKRAYDTQTKEMKREREMDGNVERSLRRRCHVSRCQAVQTERHRESCTAALKTALQRKSSAEESADVLLETIALYRNVMTENRKYRQSQHKLRKEEAMEDRLKRDQAFLDTALDLHKKCVKAQMERVTAAMNAATNARRALTEKLCRDVLNEAVDLAVEVSGFRTYTAYHSENNSDGGLVPPAEWSDLLRLYEKGPPLLCLYKAYTSNDSSTPQQQLWMERQLLRLCGDEDQSSISTLKETDNTSADTAAAYLDSCDVTDYIEGSGSYTYATEDASPVVPSSTSTACMPTLIKEATSTPHVSVLTLAPPAYGLGESIIEASIAVEALPAVPSPPDLPSFSLRICMSGPTFTGKSEQALRLAERYSLKLLSVDELLRNAVDLAQTTISASDTSVNATCNPAILRLGQTALAHIMRGDIVPDTVYVRLLFESIQALGKENKAADLEGHTAPWFGWVIDDFPETVPQAREFQRLLTGVDDLTIAPHRLDRTSKLAPAMEKGDGVSPSQQLLNDTPKAVDMIIYLQADPETVIRRCLGRRVDPDTGTLYHMEHNLPHYDDMCKEMLVQPIDPFSPVPELAYQVATQAAGAVELCKSLKCLCGEFVEVSSGANTRPDGLFAAINGHVSPLVDRIVTAQLAPLTLNVSENVEESTIAEEMAGESHTPSDALAQENGGEAKVNDVGTAEAIPPTSTTSSSAPRRSSKQSLNSSSTLKDAERRQSSSVPIPEIEEPPLPDVCQGPVFSGVLAKSVFEHWSLAVDQFEITARGVFRAFRHQRAVISQQLHNHRNAFKAVLASPHNLQSVLEGLVRAHNCLPLDMRFDVEAKSELALRVEEARSSLWESLEARRSAAEGILNSIKEDGWVEHQVAMADNLCLVLLQGELDRFHAGISLLIDYHAAMTQDSNSAILLAPLIGGAPEAPASKKGAKDQPPAPGLNPITRGALPFEVAKIDLIKESGYQRTSSQDAKGKGESADTKKGSKKGAVQVEGTPIERATTVATNEANKWSQETFSEPSPLIQQDLTSTSTLSEQNSQVQSEHPYACLHRAVWHEAGLFIRRIKRIRRMAETVQKLITSKFTSEMEEMQRWLHVQTQKEERAVEAAISLARSAIDNEAQIERVWEFQNGTFSVSTTSRIIPPAVVPDPPVVITYDSKKFNDKQLNEVKNVLIGGATGTGEEDGYDWVLTDDFIDIYRGLRDTTCSLPKEWAALSDDQLKQLIHDKLDPLETGSVAVGDIIKLFSSSG